MKNRVRQIRKSLNMTQAEFGAEIGKGRDSIANIENGRVAVDETMVKLLCSKYGYDEHWLRTGEGDPKPKPSPDEALAKLAGEALAGKCTEDQQLVMQALSGLDEAGWKAAAQIIRELKSIFSDDTG